MEGDRGRDPGRVGAESGSSKRVGSGREIQSELLPLIKSLQYFKKVDPKILFYLHLESSEQTSKRKFIHGLFSVKL